MIFDNEYSFLSNFHNSTIKVKLLNITHKFQCTEALYQAMKSSNKHDWYDFQFYNGGKSKRMGKRIKIRTDWEEVKESVMEKIIRLKFSQHPNLAKRLVEIEEEIVEHNVWHDNIWGQCTCKNCEQIVGSNKLGKILMKVRQELIDEVKV